MHKAKQSIKRSITTLGAVAVTSLLMSTQAFGSGLTPPIEFDNFEHGNLVFMGWFAYGSGIGSGGIDPNAVDLAPIPGNTFGMQASWSSNSVPGYLGGFGWNNPTDIMGSDTFTMWINPDPGQFYTLEINLQEDDNNDGIISGDTGDDDEFQFNCEISPAGPCAIAGGGWQKIEIPLNAFVDDNTYLFGGDGILNATSTNNGNGDLIEIAIDIFSQSGGDVTFRTDQWQFETQQSDSDGDGVADDTDNCTLLANPGQQDTDSDGFGDRCDPDVDNSCVVNFIDISQFPAVFLTTNPLFDFDSSGGAVNFVDFSILISFFQMQPGPSALASCDN